MLEEVFRVRQVSEPFFAYFSTNEVSVATKSGLNPFCNAQVGEHLIGSSGQRVHRHNVPAFKEKAYGLVQLSLCCCQFRNRFRRHGNSFCHHNPQAGIMVEAYPTLPRNHAGQKNTGWFPRGDSAVYSRPMRV